MENSNLDRGRFLEAHQCVVKHDTIITNAAYRQATSAPQLRGITRSLDSPLPHIDTFDMALVPPGARSPSRISLLDSCSRTIDPN
jgi:hypothetical protein